MKTITKTFNVYSYSELNKAAQDVVKEHIYLERSNDEFDVIQDEVDYLLNLYFSCSDIHVKDTNYYTGNVISLGGVIDINEVLNILYNKNLYDEKEYRTLKFYLWDYGYDYKGNLSETDRTYLYLYYDILETLESHNISGINKALLKKFDDDINEYAAGCMEEINKFYESYLNVTEDDVIEETYQQLFYDNGSFYGYDED